MKIQNGRRSGRITLSCSRSVASGRAMATWAMGKHSSATCSIRPNIVVKSLLERNTTPRQAALYKLNLNVLNIIKESL